MEEDIVETKSSQQIMLKINLLNNGLFQQSPQRKSISQIQKNLKTFFWLIPQQAEQNFFNKPLNVLSLNKEYEENEVQPLNNEALEQECPKVWIQIFVGIWESFLKNPIFQSKRIYMKRKEIKTYFFVLNSALISCICIYLMASGLKSQNYLSIYNQKDMVQSQSQSFHEEKQKNYIRVSQKGREKLIQLVFSKGRKVVSAAKVLRINPETAKMIVYRHRKKIQRGGNEWEEKKRQEKKRLEDKENEIIQKRQIQILTQKQNIQKQNQSINIPSTQILWFPISFYPQVFWS